MFSYVKNTHSTEVQTQSVARRKSLPVFLLIATLVFALILTSCGQTSDKSEGSAAAATAGSKKTVYTTIYSVYDFTRKLAGADFNVQILMPPGTEAHDWEPGPQDMAKLSEADALIYSGVEMEPWVDDLLAAGGSNIKAVDSSVNVPLIAADAEHDEHEDEAENKHDEHEHETAEEHAEHDEHEHEDATNDEHAGHTHGVYDPHIWLDPQNVAIQMKNIASALIELDPEKKQVVEERLQAEEKKLSELDQKLGEALQPFAGRRVIVGHEAFAYLFKAYQLEQLGIEGLLSSSEPSPRHMADLVKIAKADGIKVVYVEPLGSSKTAESLAAEIGGKVEYLDPYEGLSPEEEAAGKDYFNVMEENLNALLSGF